MLENSNATEEKPVKVFVLSLPTAKKAETLCCISLLGMPIWQVTIFATLTSSLYMPGFAFCSIHRHSLRQPSFRQIRR